MRSERKVLFQKLHYLLHRALVDVRNAVSAQDDARAFDLADTFEILPTLMAEWEDRHLDLIRPVLAAYQAKYQETGCDYLSILDMDDDQFLAVYGSHGGYR